MSVKGRLALAAVLIAFPALAMQGATAQASSRPPASGKAQAPKAPIGRNGQFGGAAVINIRQLVAQPQVARPRLTHPPVRPNAGAYASRSAAERLASPAAPSSPRTVTTTQGSLEEPLTVFPGIDIVQAVQALGNSQNLEPPDTHIAAGPTTIVEVVNNNMSVWSKAGARQSLVDLNIFYSVPTGFGVSDPRVLYDAGSGRFIMTAFAQNANADSNVYLAVSQTSDPTGTWFSWTPKAILRTITDQPKVGVSDDKVTISWAEAIPPTCNGQTTNVCFVGQQTYVIQKSDLLAVPQVGSPHTTIFGPDLNRFGIVPVQSLSSTTTQYLVYNNADPAFLVENACGTPPQNILYWNCPTLGLVSITGTPLANSVSASEVDLPVAPTIAPPNAVQAGNPSEIQTGDDRLLSAVWRNNVLWTALTDGNYCGTVNPQSNPPGACLRAFEVGTLGGAMLLSQPQIGNGAGDYLYDPALSVDNAGDVMAVFSRSNGGLHPGVWISGRRPASAWSPISMLHDGNGPYDTTATCGGHNRWGDYSGAASDPADPSDVWLAGEYALFYQNSNTCTWGTAIGRVTYSLPTVTSITPNGGPRSAGTPVTVNGMDFVTGSTSVYLASAGLTNVVVKSPDQLTGLTPYGTGVVPVSATTPEGHGAPGPMYTYAARMGAPPASASQRGLFPSDSAPPRPPQLTAPVNRPTPPPHRLLSGQTVGTTTAATPGGSLPINIDRSLIDEVRLAIARVLQLLW